MPGTVTEGKRAVWELGQVQVDDGGADGDADTAGDNTLFMVQGVFVPSTRLPRPCGSRSGRRSATTTSSSSATSSRSSSRPSACGACARPLRLPLRRRAAALAAQRRRASWRTLRIFNPDGSEAELSGNGAREAILYLRRQGWTDQDEFSIETAAGEVRPDDHLGDAPAASRWGGASLRSPDFPSGGDDGRGTVIVDGREFAFQHVSIGNPQCVIQVGEGLEELDLAAHRPADRAQRAVPEPHQRVVHPTSTSDERVRARIFERGVGETLASGTGASGAAVTAVLRGAHEPGDRASSTAASSRSTSSDDLDVTLTGWAEPVFAGEFSDEFVRALEEAT